MIIIIYNIAQYLCYLFYTVFFCKILSIIMDLTVHTVHSESIQTPSLFIHLVTLQPYSIPHNDEAKNVFLEMLANV